MLLNVINLDVAKKKKQTNYCPCKSIEISNNLMLYIEDYVNEADFSGNKS